MGGVRRGGGIGGLATALGLAQKGHGVVVLEKAAALGEIGAGIQLGPNSFHSFDYLGVGDAARAMAIYIDGLRLMDAINAFDLDRILEIEPEFLEGDGHDHAHDHHHDHDRGHDHDHAHHHHDGGGLKHYHDEEMQSVSIRTDKPLNPAFDRLVKPTKTLLFSPEQVAANRKAWVDEWLAVMSK